MDHQTDGDAIFDRAVIGWPVLVYKCLLLLSVARVQIQSLSSLHEPKSRKYVNKDVEDVLEL